MGHLVVVNGRPDEYIKESLQVTAVEINRKNIYQTILWSEI